MFCHSSAYLFGFLHTNDFDNVLVFVELGLEGPLYLHIKLHENHIESVTGHQHHALPPDYDIIQEEDDE